MFWPVLPATAGCAGDLPMIGKVDVSQVDYDDAGLLRSFTATFRWRCSSRLDEQAMLVQVSPSGADRAPAPWLRLTPPTAGARAVLGTPHTSTWTLTNDGTGSAQVTGASIDRADTTVDADGCVGALAPGASCTITAATPYADDAPLGEERAELRVRSTDPSADPGSGPDGQDDARLPDTVAAATWLVVPKATGAEGFTDGYAVPDSPSRLARARLGPRRDRRGPAARRPGPATGRRHVGPGRGGAVQHADPRPRPAGARRRHAAARPAHDRRRAAADELGAPDHRARGDPQR